MKQRNPKRLPRALARVIRAAQDAVLELQRVERSHGPTPDRETINARVELAAALYLAGYPTINPDVCVGHGPHGGKARCCPRAGEYNGFGSGSPHKFICPAHCSCHD